MIIYEPKLVVTEHYCCLETNFEANGKNGTLWYKFPIEFKEYIVVEQSDSAIVALMVLAMKNGEDIYIKGAISTKLYYTLTTYLIDALCFLNSEYSTIIINAESFSDKVFNNQNSTSTGISCGIDSFSTIITHLNIEEKYRVKCLTHLNAGSHGLFGGEISNKIYNQRLSRIREFSKSIDFPLIEISSNVADMVQEDFQKLHSIFHLSCILAIQKKIGIYYYASAYRFDHFNLNKNDTSDWDMMLLKLIETESLSFYSSMSQSTRYRRTEIISNYEPSYKYLDVCTASHVTDKINCSKCEKCLRTQITLELIGKLNSYNEVFNLKVYEQYKDKYIADLVSKKNLNQINQELYLKLNLKGEIKFKHYFMSTISLFWNKVYNLKMLLKKAN